MSFDIGYHYDLTHLNRKSATALKKSLSPEKHWIKAAGTRLILRLTPQGDYKAALQIPIMAG